VAVLIAIITEILLSSRTVVDVDLDYAVSLCANAPFFITITGSIPETFIERSQVAGGGKAVWPASKQSSMSSAVPRRGLMDSMPKSV
jgi:hypothetical protein